MTEVTATKFTHSCVRFDTPEGSLVIDPGCYTEPEALSGVHHIVITHDHPDHIDDARARQHLTKASSAQIWSVRSVVERFGEFGERVREVADGDVLELAGLTLRALGGLHAQIHPDIPRIDNIGVLINEVVFHPGDALTVLDRPLELLFAPLWAPWLRAAMTIDWLRQMRAERTVMIHDAMINEYGSSLLTHLLGPNGPGVPTHCEFVRSGTVVWRSPLPS